MSQAENLRSTALRKQAGEVLAAWQHETRQKQSARLAAQELHLKECRARAGTVLIALRQLVCLSAEAEKGALILNCRRQARLQHALCLQGERRLLLANSVLSAHELLTLFLLCTSWRCLLRSEGYYTVHAVVQVAINCHGLTTKCTLPAWTVWRCASAESQRIGGLLQRCKARRRERALRKCLSAWQGAMQSRAAFRARLQEIIDARTLQLLGSAFRNWQEAAAECRQQNVRRLSLNLQTERPCKYI